VEKINVMSKIIPEISVVIPVRNEGLKIRACIEGILSQTIPVKEIIVVDSGSTDGTIEILKGYDKVTLLQISPSEFNHGETRNHGVRHASGEFVVLTVGDSQAYDRDWIKHLLNGFEDDNVAGVCGQQVCAHDTDKNPVEWFRPAGPPTKRRFEYPNGTFVNLSPDEKKAACGWDDVTAMYRRDILLQIPFRFTSFSEDAIWAKDALTAGYAIVYNSAARVFHYHKEDADFVFRRSLTTIYMRYKHFGFVLPKNTGNRSLRSKVSRLKTIFLSEPLTLREKWNWLNYNKKNEKAYEKAVHTFHEALAVGEENLDKTHEQYCGKPPIPLK
jgi:rhamnosyltransferase